MSRSTEEKTTTEQLAYPIEVMKACARALASMPVDDLGREDVRTIYAVAGQAKIADRAEFQHDPRIYVPAWLMTTYGGDSND